MPEDKKKLNELKLIISKITNNPINKLNLNSSYKNTKNWDSFAHINIVLAIEKKIKKKFSLTEVSKIESLGDCLKLYNKYKK
tara:strand:- start:1548 stop:1793 length:246 start_codon:yes stop_codon:yes gene_type:complete